MTDDAYKAVKGYLDEIDHLISGTNYVMHKLVQVRLADIMELLKAIQPPAIDLTDEAAIKHLQASGWMHKYDREMLRPPWISVKDELPENQKPVMVFVPPYIDEIEGTFIGYVGMAYYTSLGEGFWCGTDGNLYGAIGMIHTPTHWMPLPEPPKEDDADGKT